MIKINKKVWVKVVNWSFKIIFQMHFFKVITIFLIGFFFIGCKFIELKKISAEKIKLESSWSEKDQPPSFEECENFSNLIDQKLCFEKKISNLIHSGLSSSRIESNEPFESQLNITIQVDESGLFSIKDIQDNDKILDNLPNLENEITQIINNLPKALPAIKTNVGSYVNVTFNLPIKIKATISK